MVDSSIGDLEQLLVDTTFLSALKQIHTRQLDSEQNKVIMEVFASFIYSFKDFVLSDEQELNNEEE